MVMALSNANAEFKGMAKRICELLYDLRGWWPIFALLQSQKLILFVIIGQLSISVIIPFNIISSNMLKWIGTLLNKIFKKGRYNSHSWNEDQLTNILTKAMPAKSFHNSLDKLDMYDTTWGEELEWVVSR